MFKKLTLAIAAGTGYVLGAKAGRERYAQIESKFREIAGMPAVQNATETVKDTAAPLLDSAKGTVSDKVSSATDKGSSSSSSSGTSTSTPPVTTPPATTPPPSLGTTGTGATTRPTTPTTPAGTAPSGTAPTIRP
jgi:hypothetical protein